VALLVVPNAFIPGALIPGEADPGYPGGVQQGGFVNLDDTQVISGVKTFTGPGDNNTGGSGAWLGSIVTNDITIRPNPEISASASMFLDNRNGEVWEFFCSANSDFGVYSKTTGGQVLTIGTQGRMLTLNSTELDDGSGNMSLAGGLSAAVRTITGSATLTATDSTVLLNAATLTATLPTAAGRVGRVYTVKLIASGTTGTVATTSSQTIDGGTTYSLSAQYKYVTVVSDGAAWFITASN
jgi:hypothetical protein